MPKVRINGIDIYYEDTGGAGPVLLFSHGLMLDLEMFRPQIETLRDHYRCIAWDQRGFGHTGEVNQPFTYWDSARDALGVLDALAVTQATFIGLSQGGFVTMRAALLEPQRVKAMVLLSTCHGTDTEEVSAQLRGLFAEWRANGHENLQHGLPGLMLGKEPDPAPWQEKWSRMSKEALVHPGDTLVNRDDLTPRMGELMQPALVIHGDADQAIDISLGELLADTLPNCKGFVRVRGAAHGPPLSHPEIVTPAMETFLREWA